MHSLKRLRNHGLILPNLQFLQMVPKSLLFRAAIFGPWQRPAAMRTCWFPIRPPNRGRFIRRTGANSRSLLPTILVTNRHTLSDGEDFTEGYRSLHLGKVVGEPTAGWIIYTSGVQLIDGSALRLPYDRITANDGTLMEMHPRPVDIPVAKPIGESFRGRDSQLDAAVTELLKEIGNRSRGN